MYERALRYGYMEPLYLLRNVYKNQVNCDGVLYNIEYKKANTESNKNSCYCRKTNKRGDEALT